jgi:phospholipase C
MSRVGYGRLSRRGFLGLAGLAGAAALGSSADYVIDRALLSDPGSTGSLGDIDHIVLLMLENRSFDHYFGTMSGVRGYDDMTQTQARQHFADGTLMPFHLDTRRYANLDADVLNDPSHSWQTQHASWNRGAMNEWMTAHVAADGPKVASDAMGYYTRSDVPTHYRLADAFTVCDHYFSSVLGATAPNRMYWMTGTTDPSGAGGGPVISNAKAIPNGSLTWETYPERLLEAGVSWKVYNNHGPTVPEELSGMLKYFRAYQDPLSELYRRGVAPLFPHDFRTDVRTGTLPSVSWLIPSMADSEHPSYPPAAGANTIMNVLDILTSNRALWERTALIVSYDENGGFFDHVAPPVPPPLTAGEFIQARPPGHASVSSHDPIGLGFRVPCLVISPYSHGGFVSSDTFDHTSQLRLLTARFGVPAPNLTQWRLDTVGDLTSPFQRRPGNGKVPVAVGLPAAASEALADERAKQVQLRDGAASAFPVPANSMPRQERTPLRRHILAELPRISW